MESSALVLTLNPFPAFETVSLIIIQLFLFIFDIYLKKLLNQNLELSVLRNLSLLLSNICRHKPSPALTTVQPMLSLVYRLINFPITDEILLINTCWLCFHFTSMDNIPIDSFLAANIVPKIIELLSNFILINSFFFIFLFCDYPL